MTVLTLIAISLLGNAAGFYYFDKPHHDGLTAGDALWYSVISITTIGYGDYSATSAGARITTFLFIVVFGLATFSLLLGMSIEGITDLSLRAQRGMSTVLAKDHILIVNFPSHQRVQQLIHELQADPNHHGREIVIVSDQIDSPPFADDRVLFVRGPVLDHETYERARINDASMAIVLATSYADTNSDAVVASTVAVIESLVPEIHTVAECLNDRHRMLFNSVRCNAIVYSMKISGNLLAQEVHDPGVSRLVDMITSNVSGTTLFSATVDSQPADLKYNELAKRLLDRNVNLICVNRCDETLTSFVSLAPEADDHVIYAADKRYSWPAILDLAGC